MATNFRAMLAAGTLALLAACNTLGGSDAAPTLRGTNVTRIHLGVPAGRGEVSVEPRFATQAAGGVYEPAFATTVANELRTLGFTPAASPATSEYVATVDVATGTLATLAARAPAAGPPSPGVAALANATATQLAVQL